MGKYAFKILTQGVVKIYVEITLICSLLIFGTRPVPTKLIEHFSEQGRFYHAGFDKNGMSTTSLFSYRNRVVHDAMWQLKFKNNRKIADLFGIILADYLVEELSNQYYLEYFNAPILVIVPSSRQSIKKRGYNPVALIAESMLRHCPNTDLEYQPGAIRKIKHTVQQSRIKNRARRLQNPKNSFTITNPNVIKERNIILLDDVYTTGATIDEVTRILKKSGASKIMRITIAH